MSLYGYFTLQADVVFAALVGAISDSGHVIGIGDRGRAITFVTRRSSPLLAHRCCGRVYALPGRTRLDLALENPDRVGVEEAAHEVAHLREILDLVGRRLLCPTTDAQGPLDAVHNGRQHSPSI